MGACSEIGTASGYQAPLLAQQQPPLDHPGKDLGVRLAQVGAVALADFEEPEKAEGLQRLPDRAATGAGAGARAGGFAQAWSGS